jgi:hypothetical protein
VLPIGAATRRMWRSKRWVPRGAAEELDWATHSAEAGKFITRACGRTPRMRCNFGCLRRPRSRRPLGHEYQQIAPGSGPSALAWSQGCHNEVRIRESTGDGLMRFGRSECFESYYETRKFTDVPLGVHAVADSNLLTGAIFAIQRPLLPTAVRENRHPWPVGSATDVRRVRMSRTERPG